MLAAGLLAALMAVSVAVAQVGAAVVARHRAQAAADLAALAAAGRLADGQLAACAAGRAVAAAMRAETADCAVQGLDVTVVVTVPVHLGRWGSGHARAGARAGPI